MQTFLSTPTSLYVLKKGEELMAQLEVVARERSLSSAWVNIIGGASAVTLGYYNPEAREYQWTDFNEPLEILGLSGNLAIVDGKPMWHIHGTFGRADSSVLGGHVRSCTIGLTGEIALTPIDAKLTRTYDGETGLNLLTEAK